MAHLNIKNRRDAVVAALGDRTALSAAEKRTLAAEFNCSVAAVFNDVVEVIRGGEQVGNWVNHSMRRRILQRDGRTCQYCGQFSMLLVIEHIVPRALGGPARDHNLVAACDSCNGRKGRTVWTPLNLDAITVGYEDWREKIILLSKPRPL